MKKIFILILFIGILFRLLITANGNFLFNMDNARDMVDVRGMVVLHKLRLTGPTSAIDGLYNGPGWYYLLSIPFIISGGDPYASILMEIVLWAIGGFFLLKLTSRFNKLIMLVAGSLWIGSNFIVLASVYAFNPNPVLFLMPLLIFLIEKYISTGKLSYSLLMWFLSGLFFNFEMNIGIFIPLIILLTILFTRKTNLLKNKNFWIGSIAFIALLMPQVLFDIKYHFAMSKAVLAVFSKGSAHSNLRMHDVYGSFFNVFSATLFNQDILTKIVIILITFYVINPFKSKEYFKDYLSIVCLLFIFVPFFGYTLFIPVAINSWHLGAECIALVILLCVILSKLIKAGLIARIFAYVISILIMYFCIAALSQYFTHDRFIKSDDPSNYANELAAIDYVYTYTKGQNFKVYTYLPSVYDYPYQYLFWWYGKKKYGYIPAEYRYSPNKPSYIANQDKFEGTKDNLSDLVFLIKEPDRIKYRQAWENDYKNMQFVSKEMVGPIEVEIRRDTNIP